MSDAADGPDEARRANNAAAKVTAEPHSIILIHGTGSTPAPEGREKRWWEPGSKFRDALHTRLGGRARCYPDDRPYRWSGGNSQTERLIAALNLLEEIADLEEQSIPYHLIGHSHGGSVMFMALKLCMFLNLKMLKSCCTIGTPFLFGQKSYNRGFIRNKYEKVIYDSYDVIKNFDILLSRYLGIWTRSDEAIAGLRRASVFGEPIISRPTSTSRMRDLFTEVKAREKKAKGGQLSTQKPMRLLHRYYEMRLFFRSPVMQLQRLMAPLGDRWIRSKIRDRIFGNDLGMRIHQVSHGPVILPNAMCAFQPLDDEIDKEMVRRANAAVGESAPALREAFAMATVTDSPIAFEKALKEVAGKLSYRELVHNLYFECEEVSDLCALHIERSLGDGESTMGDHRYNQGLVAWYDRFRAGVRQHAIGQLNKLPY
jgi:hypothetical protein